MEEVCEVLYFHTTMEMVSISGASHIYLNKLFGSCEQGLSFSSNFRESL